MAEVVLDKNGFPQNFNNLDIPLSEVSVNTNPNIDLPLSQLGYNISQKRASGNYGIYGNWNAAGTAIAASGTQTPIDISGKGKLSQVRFQNKYASMLCRIYLDQTYAIYPDCDANLSDLWAFAGAVGTYGLVQITHKDDGNSKYGVIYSTRELNDGIWGASLKVIVTNPDAGAAHEAYILINYITTASREFKMQGSVVPDAKTLRQELAARLGLEPGDLTVILAHNWDDALGKNRRDLSVLYHPQGNAALYQAIKKEIAAAEAVKADLVQEEDVG